MNLVLEPIQQTPVKYSCILFLRGDDHRVRLLDIREVVFTVGHHNVVADAFLKDFPKLLTLLGIRPQNKDGMAHSLSQTLSARRETIVRKMQRRINEKVRLWRKFGSILQKSHFEHTTSLTKVHLCMRTAVVGRALWVS